MKKSEQLRAAIAKFAGKELLDEIDYFENMLTNKPRPLSIAFIDAKETFETERNKKALNQIKKIQFELGLFRPLSDEEFQNTQIFSSGNRIDKRSVYPLINGRRHEYITSNSEFELDYNDGVIYEGEEP
jgi:hypothetical protein